MLPTHWVINVYILGIIIAITGGAYIYIYNHVAYIASKYSSPGGVVNVYVLCPADQSSVILKSVQK